MVPKIPHKKLHKLKLFMYKLQWTLTFILNELRLRLLGTTVIEDTISIHRVIHKEWCKTKSKFSRRRRVTES